MQFSCLVYTVILHVPLWLQMCYTVELPTPREYPTGLFIGLWPHSFHKIMYLYSICLVSTTCCDATIMPISNNKLATPTLMAELCAKHHLHKCSHRHGFVIAVILAHVTLAFSREWALFIQKAKAVTWVLARGTMIMHKTLERINHNRINLSRGSF